MSDREKIMKDLEICSSRGNCFDCDYFGTGTVNGGCVNRLQGDALALVKEQKHGHWVVHLYKYGHNRYECGECKNTTDVPYPYCPWCSAKMDVEMKQE